MRRLLLVILVGVTVFAVWALLQDRGERRVERRSGAGRVTAPSVAPVEAPTTTETKDAPAAKDPFPTSIYDVKDAGITVIALGANWDPVAGARIFMLDNMKRKIAEGVTDAKGRYHLPKPPRRRIRVYYDPGDGFPRQLLRALRGPGTVRFHAMPVRTLVARITVDGKPELPAELKIRGAVLAEIARDEPACSIVARCLPMSPFAALEASAPGLLPGRTRIQFTANESVTECTIALHHAVTAQIRVRGKRDVVDHLMTRRMNEFGSWSDETLLRFRGGESPDLWIAEPELRRGTYQLVTPQVHMPLQEFTILRPQQIIEHDLRAAGWVQVDVTSPGNAASRIVFEGPGFDRPVFLLSGPLFLHPGDRAITLYAAASGCRPHPTLGRKTIRTPVERIELHLVEAKKCRLRWRRPPGAAPPTIELSRGRTGRLTHSSPPSSLSIGLRAVGEATVNSIRANRTDEPWQYAFTPPREGQFDLIVQEPGGAIVLVRNALLTGAVDLGTLQAKSAHDLELRVRNRSPAHYLRVSAVDLESRLRLTEAIVSGSQTSASLTGLPPGRIELRFELGGATWTKTITCAGGKAQVVEVDCAER